MGSGPPVPHSGSVHAFHKKYVMEQHGRKCRAVFVCFVCCFMSQPAAAGHVETVS